MRFSKQISLERDVRCLTIMGRTHKEKLDVAQYLYPPMQATDIHAMDLDVVHAGHGPEEGAHAREGGLPVARLEEAGRRPPPHPRGAPGAAGERASTRTRPLDRIISSKMSKSKPDTAIFIHDSPAGDSEEDRQGLVPGEGGRGQPHPGLCSATSSSTRRARFTIERPEKFGGNVTFGELRRAGEGLLRGEGAPERPEEGRVARELAEILEPGEGALRRERDNQGDIWPPRSVEL